METKTSEPPDYKAIRNILKKVPRTGKWFKIKPEWVETAKKVMSDYNWKDMEFNNEYTCIRHLPPLSDFKNHFKYFPNKNN